MKKPMRRRLRPQSLAASASYPGVDPRVWLTLATVTEVGYVPLQGVFVDVTYAPLGEKMTAYVGLPYAGDGFGAWYPLEVNDVVLVAVPHGDDGHGPVVVARLWSGSAPPPSPDDLDWLPNAAALEPPTDVVIRMKPGVAYKLRGSGADIDIRVEGTGDVVIENRGTGKVKLGLAATAVPIALAPLVTAIFTALQSAVAATVIVPGDGGAALKTALATALTAAAQTAIGTLKTEAT